MPGLRRSRRADSFSLYVHPQGRRLVRRRVFQRQRRPRQPIEFDAGRILGKRPPRSERGPARSTSHSPTPLGSPPRDTERSGPSRLYKPSVKRNREGVSFRLPPSREHRHDSKSLSRRALNRAGFPIANGGDRPGTATRCIGEQRLASSCAETIGARIPISMNQRSERTDDSDPMGTVKPVRGLRVGRTNIMFCIRV